MEVPSQRPVITGRSPAVPLPGWRAAIALLNRVRLRLWDCRICVISVLLGLATLLMLAPAQDLLLEVRSIPSVIGFAAVVLVFWTIPVYNAAVRSIEALPRRHESASRPVGLLLAVDTWLPRLLGAATLLIVLLAAHKTAHSLDSAKGIPEVDTAVSVLRTMRVCMLAAAVVFAGYVVLRQRVLASRGTSFFASLLRAMPSALGLLTFLALIFAILDPSSFVRQVGREDLVPVILGGWVPLFSYLTVLSQRTGWPLTIFTILAFIVISTFHERFHDVRTFRSAAWDAAHEARSGAAARQIYIGDAIDGWMTANSCAADPDRCPPVVLIAAEGGGNRAAFYTATVLGALLDGTRDDPDGHHDFGRSIFAMSGVSGGALGITIARTALADAAGTDRPPCRHLNPVWFGAAAPGGNDPNESWRACLQSITAGDYLSPSILGATFRDALASLLFTVTGVSVADRAALLEQAIEAQYNMVVTGEHRHCGGAEDQRGLCRPFGYLPKAAPGQWLPLLFLNAASVDSGRQIMATDLEVGADSPEPGHCRELYPFSYGVFEILASGVAPDVQPDTTEHCTFPGLADADDIRLSTAIVLGARFPLISPKGNLRNRAGMVTERVVDGAFFDNTGLEPLLPLIPILRERGLHPLVIHIADVPWEERPPGAYEVPGRDADRSDPHHIRLNTSEHSPWGDLVETVTSTLLALNSARIAHSERVEEATIALLAGDKRAGYVTPRLYRTPDTTGSTSADLCNDELEYAFSLRNLSMSWWISPVVQKVIDLQLCDRRDALLLADILTRLKVVPPAE